MGITNRDRLIEGFATTTINKLNLARILRVIDPFLAGKLSRLFEVRLDSLLGFLSSVHLIKRNYLHPATKVGGSPAH